MLLKKYSHSSRQLGIFEKKLKINIFSQLLGMDLTMHLRDHQKKLFFFGTVRG